MLNYYMNLKRHLLKNPAWFSFAVLCLNLHLSFVFHLQLLLNQQIHICVRDDQQ